ncbi:flagellar hook-length control protein FliK [Sphingosinicella sp.]|uniref:flagellar hook-length control protein FliK n=1 Tax=Sphingosinicella sp. TaxID=1917971 RepID=UPI004038239A
MASVPNLPIAPAVPTPGVPGAPDADGAALDFFAQLLSGGPLVAIVAGLGATPAEAVTLRAAPPEGEAESAPGETAPDGAAQADIIPLLQAQSGFPVAVVPVTPVAAAVQTEAAPVQMHTVPVAQPNGAKAQFQAASTLRATPDTQAISPAGDDAAGAALVDAAVKAAVEKIGGKPAARAEKPGRATSVALPQSKSAEPAAVSITPRAPEPVVARIETAVQPAVPVSATISTISAAPQTTAPVAAPAANAAPAVADLVVERQLDLANDNQWLDRLARDIARAGATDEPLRFRLHPQTLGTLQVELSQGERGATVRLTVETEAARNLLIDAQPRLAAEARAQGVRLAGTEVDLGTATQQGGDPRRNAEAQPNDVVRIVRGTRPDTNSSAPAPGRSDRYA